MFFFLSLCLALSLFLTAVYFCCVSQYVTDFEWYIGVLVRLTRVPGNEQGKLIADQFLDVAVRVEAVRRFCVKQMILLLQDEHFFNSQSAIVEGVFV